MVDTTEYIESEFVKAAQIPMGGRKVVVTGPGDFVETKFGSQLLVQVEIGGQQKKLGMNKTNTRQVSEEFGIDTQSWVGKTLILTTFRVKNKAGEMVDAIDVRPVSSGPVEERVE